MTYDVAKNLTANGFTRTSYKFIGWNTKADGTGTNYTNKQSVKNLTTTNGATITFYAKWEYDPVLAVNECDIYSGAKSNKTTLFGITKGNVFDDYVYKTDYPTIGDTVWYNIYFPAEKESFKARQYVRYKGGSWTTRDSCFILKSDDYIVPDDYIGDTEECSLYGLKKVKETFSDKIKINTDNLGTLFEVEQYYYTKRQANELCEIFEVDYDEMMQWLEEEWGTVLEDD